MAEENQNQQPAPNPERKTLDDRAKMTELERIRHSSAHVLATAILRLWPDAQFAYGPPVENGFYYDLECSHRISPDDFEKIEAEMKKEIKRTIPSRNSRSPANRPSPMPRVAGWAAWANAPATPANSSSICLIRFPRAKRSPITRTAISLTCAPGRT